MAYYVGAAAASTLGYITGDAVVSEGLQRAGFSMVDSGVAGAFSGLSIYNRLYEWSHPNTQSTDRTLVNDRSELTQKRLNFRRMPYRVAPSLDHLPGGLSASTVKINLGGKPKFKSRGNMHYMTQLTADISNNNTETSATSGNQAIGLVGGMFYIGEFCATVISADNLDAIGKNIFNFNPDQLTTGSGYTTATAGGLGAVSTATYTAGVPLQDFINWKSTRFIYDITNLTNIPCFGTFYICKAVRDLPVANTAIGCWNYGDQNFKIGNTEANLPATGVMATGEYWPSRELVHAVPTSSLRFRQSWKVIKVQPCNLAAGGYCKLKFDIEVNRTYDRELMQRKLADNIAYPKGAIQIFFVGHGAPVMSTLAGSTGLKYGLCNVGMIVTRKDNYGFVDRQKHWSTAMAYSNQTDRIAVTDQKFVGEQDLGRIAVHDINGN